MVGTNGTGFVLGLRWFYRYSRWQNSPFYIFDKQKDYIVFRLSSQYDNKSDFIKSKYIEITDWKSVGLSKKSWIDTVQTYQLPIDMTKLTYIGKLSKNDYERLINHLKEQ